MKEFIRHCALLICGLTALSGCSFPYAPKKLDQRLAVSSGNGDTVLSLFSINTGRQICNPSISQDTIHYKGCMLWLNFSGDLSVDKGGFAGFSTHAAQHDRLTVTDTSNIVRWYMMNSDFGLSNELQDPEWSNHRDYIAFIGGVGSGPAAKFYGYAVRLSDKKFLKMAQIAIGGEATPFIWLPDSTVSAGLGGAAAYQDNGFADSVSIKRFFGTRSVKFVYANKDAFLHIRFVDYSQNVIEPVDLPVPDGRESWNCESPLVSPDGDWIVYNCYESSSRYECYAQRLKAGSKPILISASGSDPHWWSNPADPALQYIVYQTCKDNFVQEDLTDASLLKTGQAGVTYAQRIFSSPGDLPDFASFTLIGDPQTLVKLPFKGGLSRDGWFLCTGYANGFIMKLR